MTEDASIMVAETAEQPDVLRWLLERKTHIQLAVYRTMPRTPRGITLVGRGTSANAALYGRYVLELATGVPASVFPPSLVMRYGSTADYGGYLAIGLSQSGHTRDVQLALRALKAHGATTIALTADPQSPIAQDVDLCVNIGAGLERAVPATKTFTAEIAALAIIAEGLSETGWQAGDWDAVVASVEQVLGDGAAAAKAAASLDGIAHLSVIGDGVLTAIAQEGALKIAETTRIAAAGYSALSFRHGPMTIADTSHPVIALVGGAEGRDEVLRLAGDLQDEHVPVLFVASEANRLRDGVLRIPGALPDALLAIPAAVRFQQLAVALARRRGLDPDRPRRLKKVTIA